jgi:hypothetical protein
MFTYSIVQGIFLKAYIYQGGQELPHTYGALHSLKMPAFGFCPEPGESILHPHTLSLQN